MTGADFSRVHALPDFGAVGQAAVEQGRVLIVGVGGLGCPAARYLAAAGVGHLRLVDFDTVGSSDLHRQILFAAGDEGRPKATLAAQRLAAYSPGFVEGMDTTFDPSHLDGMDVIVDCTDEPGTRAAVHQACQDAGLPLVWAAIEGWDGQAAVIRPGGPCLRCLWPEPSDAPGCADAGVLGPMTGVLGAWQATQALRLLAGHDVGGRLHLWDGQADTWQTITMQRRTTCHCAAAAK